MKRFRLLTPLLAVLILTSCGRKADGGTSSETNWLAACETDSECGSGMCLCGVCTLSCNADSDCDAVAANAECLNVASLDACEGNVLGAVCGATGSLLSAVSVGGSVDGGTMDPSQVDNSDVGRTSERNGIDGGSTIPPGEVTLPGDNVPPAALDGGTPPSPPDDGQIPDVLPGNAEILDPDSVCEAGPCDWLRFPGAQIDSLVRVGTTLYVGAHSEDLRGNPANAWIEIVDMRTREFSAVETQRGRNVVRFVRDGWLYYSGGDRQTFRMATEESREIEDLPVPAGPIAVSDSRLFFPSQYDGAAALFEFPLDASASPFVVLTDGVESRFPIVEDGSHALAVQARVLESDGVPVDTRGGVYDLEGSDPLIPLEDFYVPKIVSLLSVTPNEDVVALDIDGFLSVNLVSFASFRVSIPPLMNPKVSDGWLYGVDEGDGNLVRAATASPSDAQTVLLDTEIGFSTAPYVVESDAVYWVSDDLLTTIVRTPISGPACNTDAVCGPPTFTCSDAGTCERAP